MKVCLDFKSESCVNGSVTEVMSPSDRMKVKVAFSNLTENKKYSASVQLHVLYNGSVKNITLPAVEISECLPVQISVTMLCLQVHMMLRSLL